MKKGVKKKMTIDKLAVLLKAGFGGVNKKIDSAVDLIDKLAASTLKGFESVDKRFDGIDGKIEGVKKDVEGVKNQLAGTNKRIDDFAETKVSKTTYKELENRVGFVEKKLEIKK